MKIYFLSVLAAATGGVLVHAAGLPQTGCCSDTPAAPTCCAKLSDGTALALTSHSIYQLDSAWTNDTGAAVELHAFRGQPVIVAMFFAHCEYACPMIVNDIQRVRASLPAQVRAKTKVLLVSFDSERDTPAELRAYRERLGLDASWVLLRGPIETVQEFAMLLGVKFKQDARGQFAHSNLITVLNAEGEIAHQRPGLQGDVSEVAQAVVLAAR